MIEQFRRFLSSTGGKVVITILAFGLITFAMYSVKSFLKGDTPDSAFHTMYICTETGKAFDHQNKVGETVPILSPYSGKNTGVPAEACYWTADGGTMKDPTWVLLNTEIGKPEPTFCPVCGRLVVARNPPPSSGRQPPPTKEEWFAQHPKP
jgi:hypothetical protein